MTQLQDEYVAVRASASSGANEDVGEAATSAHDVRMVIEGPKVGANAGSKSYCEEDRAD